MSMKNSTQIIAFLVAILIVGGLAHHRLGGAPVVTPPDFAWDKPTTDALWAEDVKAESLDVRSDAVLEDMRQSQTDKLVEEKDAFKKYADCPQCINYTYYQNFLAQNMDDNAAKNEADRQTQIDIDQRQWEIGKIAQSIERITHEQDLRARKVVTRTHLIDK